MKANTISIRRLAWAFLAGTSALLLVVALSLLLSRSRALAQPAAEATVAELRMETSAVTITSQTRSPEKWALITLKGTLAITGVAWGDKAPPYPGDPFLHLINNNGNPNYVVDWDEAISATYYALYEATSPYFEDVTQTIYYGSQTDFGVTNEADGTYYYRVKAYNNVNDQSRWSNVVSATVGVGSASTPVTALDTPIGIADTGSITVQVSISGSEWSNVESVTANAGGWWDWSHTWSLPEMRYTQYTIQTRACGEDGIFGPTDTITVTLNNEIYVTYFPYIFKRWPPVPYAPTLDNIDNTDEDGNYTVSWSYDYTDISVLTYTLEEATDANFTTNLIEYHPGSSKSQAISDKDAGTYYYRVRGHNEYGGGQWSDVKSATVHSYHYDFSGSGENAWPIRRTSLYEGDKWHGTWTMEQDNSLYILMNDKWDFAIASPWEVAPPPPYVIQTRVQIHDPSNLVAYGIIFGGNDGSPCPAYRDTGCLTHYYRLEVVWDSHLKAQLKRIDYHEADKGKGRGTELISYRYIPGGGGDWNTWKFVVKTDGIDLYINGALWESVSDNRYVNEPYFGIYASANEYKPAIGRFDYYYVDPQ